MKKILYTLAALLFCTAASAADIIVKVEYNGNSAVVTIPAEANGYVSNLNGESSHVKLLQSSTTTKNPGEINQGRQAHQGEYGRQHGEHPERRRERLDVEGLLPL